MHGTLKGKTPRTRLWVSTAAQPLEPPSSSPSAQPRTCRFLHAASASGLVGGGAISGAEASKMGVGLGRDRAGRRGAAREQDERERRAVEEGRCDGLHGGPHCAAALTVHT